MNGIVLVGCTPGDQEIKSILTIPRETNVEFIRWNLTLSAENAAQKSFRLHIVFGESQPNTLGFKGGGQTRVFEGRYEVEFRAVNGIRKEVYTLESADFSSGLAIVRLDDNTFHLLTLKDRLMIGNGGWSYTLNRKHPVSDELELPALISTHSLSRDTSTRVVFDGRTPCQEIAADHPEMGVSQACFKLKWRLILNRDAITHQPTSYTVRKVVDGEARDVSGNWRIISEPSTNIIYELVADEPGESIFLLAGDENVLFFLKKDGRLYAGNEDFSFTLNRRFEPAPR